MKTITRQSLSRLELGHEGWKEVRGIPTKDEGDSPTKGEGDSPTKGEGRVHEGKTAPRRKGERWVPPRRVKRDRKKNSFYVFSVELQFAPFPFSVWPVKTKFDQWLRRARDIYHQTGKIIPQCKIMGCIPTTWTWKTQFAQLIKFIDQIRINYVNFITGYIWMKYNISWICG